MLQPRYTLEEAVVIERISVVKERSAFLWNKSKGSSGEDPTQLSFWKSGVFSASRKQLNKKKKKKKKTWC